MFTAQYYTGEGWQFITYDGMMPTGKSLVELTTNLQKLGWEFRGTHRIVSAGQSFQCKVVDLTSAKCVMLK